mmetsp:Transcript_48381/g.125466  ORF Transcript_48381/g.125466 Transcript_48381/m.125466 type:complete len:99 (+) Transcript_48381:182-478(+)
MMMSSVFGTFFLQPTAEAFGGECWSEDVLPSERFQVSLKSPNVAVARDGAIGTWTMVYDQGFEVNVAGRSFFLFSQYHVGKGQSISIIDVGYSFDSFS